MGKKHLIAAEAEGDQRSLWGEAWRRFKKNRLAMIGMYFYPGTGHHSNSNHHH